MTEALSEELTNHIATVDKDPYSVIFNNMLTPNDATLATRGGAKGLRIYDEIERDCHAFSVLQKRKLALIARPVLVESASDSLRDRKARDGVETMLDAINFDQICQDLLDATLKGFSVGEIVWEIIDGIVMLSVLPKDQRRFKFDTTGAMRLITRADMFKGEELPERKFIVHRFGAKDGNPYGVGLGTRLFWPAWFKKQGIQYWLTFSDKFGSPTAVGKYPKGAGQPEKDELLAALAALSNDAGVIIPDGMLIEFLEAARSGSINTYESLCRYMDEEMSKAVLGETLSTSMGKSGGSFAAANTHNEVRKELTQADADLLSDTLNSTLIKWFCEFNFPGAKPPKVKRDFSEPEDMEKRAATDKTVCDMGFEPSEEYIQETYGKGWKKKQAVSTTPNPAEPDTSFSESDLPPAQQAIAQGTEQLAQQFENIISPRLDNLIAVLEETNDLALFRKQLTDLVADTAMKNATDVLFNARINAFLLGRTQ